MMSNTHLSVVVPVYGCSESLEILHQRLCAALASITDHFEIILVEDASPDSSWQMIRRLATNDPKVKGIKLARNFGQHCAITAGLDCAQGDWVVVMDCDLQDQPEMIPRLYHKSNEGFEVVVGVRAKRQDGFFRKTASALFFKIFQYFTDTQIDNRIGNFGLYSRKVIHAVRQLREHHRSFGLLVIWLGFPRAEIEVQHAKRAYGKSTYNFHKMLNLAIESIISYSNKPLKLTVKIGFLLSICSFVYALWLIISYLLWGIPVAGWTSVMVSLYFLAGLNIGSIGMLGLYIGRIFDETKNRPLYIIEQTTFEAGNGSK